MFASKRAKIVATVVAVLLVLFLLAGLLVMAMGMTLFSNAAEQKREQDMNVGGFCGSPMISADGKYANPLVGRISSKFGPRPNPFGPGVLPPGYTSEKSLTFHNGVDVAGMATGTPFYAAASGVVQGTEIGGHDGGNIIIIESGEGQEWIYVHAADGTTVVRPGQQVSAGDPLAGAGMTGAATGVHLHLGLRINGTYVDPQAFLAQQGVTVGQGGPAPVQKVGATSSSSVSSSSSSSPSPSGSNSSGELNTTDPIIVPMPSGQQQKLEPSQQRNAAIIIGVGRDMGLSDQAILVALMTAWQETWMHVLASPAVPESFNYPHDKVGQNKMSVGLFQQQTTMGWGPLPNLMNPEISTRTFFGGPLNPNTQGSRGLLDYPGWESLRPGNAAQQVQRSAHPDRYHQWERTSRSMMEQITGATVLQCQSGPSKDGGTKEVKDQKEASGEGASTVEAPAGATREAIVSAARSGVGGDYVWGGADFKSWDCSGLVQWVFKSKGVNVPRINAWTVGKRTESPKPGDLVAQNWDKGNNRWRHVGIYVGDGRMVSALNPDMGTREHPVAQTGEPVYFDILGGQ
ncbi:peptidoglycan DD-metalloendopeptidase family protein [Micrococcus luteus]|uniref:peptidoglycan DD-metalloendopeptidase family protein n=1 Tax=Micrococcus luteus TaxID=1270 RepID=UPI002304CCFE|nr:peptidoglycan DD-metalloendopeptidase family protein [Micrococcus luteus]